ncbi:P-loop containing nucleoside triphosphate hydrolase superfamily protein [Forsythia ovata]|uniref:P-loop containing nucleoside triphosphate hydrolase superfamily protein n=1 Tax=Forsythia ovata TaxID=205694 RepID=A0ABD1PUA4_9LAMI
MSSSAGVTTTCELQTTVLEDGRRLNVIDTPGLFDFSAQPEFIGKEIVKCINMAKDDNLSIKMGGSAVSDNDEVRTVVLVGKTGNGKSSTGNSILQRDEFESKLAWTSVTRTCEMHTMVWEDGRILNVIDTPGLVDISDESECIEKEIIKCIDMANDGIHAVLFVMSIGICFSKEEEYAFKCLQKLFGSKIVDHMILVFTGGDKLESLTLDDYLNSSCPKPLKDIVEMCGNRRVLFDNKTQDKLKKSKQLDQLLCLVNEVVDKNDGKPYTNELFLKYQISNLKQSDASFEKQLSEEKAARLNVENEIHTLVVSCKIRLVLNRSCPKRELHSRICPTKCSSVWRI